MIVLVNICASAVLINRCKQAESAELMRREDQVKLGDVRPLRADPQRNKRRRREPQTGSSANTRIIGLVFFKFTGLIQTQQTHLSRDSEGRRQ